MLSKMKEFISKKLPFAVPFLKFIRHYANILTNILIFRVRNLFGLSNKIPHKLIRFTIHLADHCNLNCVGCNHFSPLAES